jgi:hypothetical protein
MIKDKRKVAIYYVGVHSKTMVSGSKTSCPSMVSSFRAFTWTWADECAGIGILEEQTLIGVGRESGKKGEGVEIRLIRDV